MNSYEITRHPRDLVPSSRQAIEIAAEELGSRRPPSKGKGGYFLEASAKARSSLAFLLSFETLASLPSS